YESPAVRAGPLLWVSHLYARSGGDARHQLDDVLAQLDALCRAGGTTLANLVRFRAFVLEPADAYAAYAALKDAVPADPPTVAVTTVPGPLLVPGARIAVDAVAYVS